MKLYLKNTHDKMCGISMPHYSCVYLLSLQSTTILLILGYAMIIAISYNRATGPVSQVFRFSQLLHDLYI